MLAAYLLFVDVDYSICDGDVRVACNLRHAARFNERETLAEAISNVAFAASVGSGEGQSVVLRPAGGVLLRPWRVPGWRT